MKKFPLKVEKRLENRKQENAFRNLGENKGKTDFSSNDYLGFAFSEEIWAKAYQIVRQNTPFQNGATGSRLLSGNHQLYKLAEETIARFHQSESALIFNSGFDANTGFFSSVPQRGDIILFDEFSHASIREGILLSNAKSFKFSHNNLVALEEKIKAVKLGSADVFVVTESVFSMDGDSPDLENMVEICEKYSCFLIVDEAHATGVFGPQGQGLLQELNLQHRVFARIVTFGKALGAHGAVVLGSEKLIAYLINFARSFIYTTALPPHSVATILAVYLKLSNNDTFTELQKLQHTIDFFRKKIKQFQINELFIESTSAIQSCIIPGNEQVKELAYSLQNQKFNVKPILAPTVPAGKERLRFCLHSYNSEEEIEAVLILLANFVKNKN